jgi:hypothetical protein
MSFAPTTARLNAIAVKAQDNNYILAATRFAFSDGKASEGLGTD